MDALDSSPYRIHRIDFTPDMTSRPEVQAFECGSEVWQREVSNWIKGQCLEEMGDDGCRIWLYVSEADGFVGFGSLGTTLWSWPKNSSPRVNIALIPMLGIDRHFWGKP